MMKRRICTLLIVFFLTLCVFVFLFLELCCRTDKPQSEREKEVATKSHGMRKGEALLEEPLFDLQDGKLFYQGKEVLLPGEGTSRKITKIFRGVGSWILVETPFYKGNTTINIYSLSADFSSSQALRVLALSYRRYQQAKNLVFCKNELGQVEQIGVLVDKTATSLARIGDWGNGWFVLGKRIDWTQKMIAALPCFECTPSSECEWLFPFEEPPSDTRILWLDFSVKKG